VGQLNDRLAHIKQQLNEAAASWYYRVLSNIHGPDEAKKMTYPEMDETDPEQRVDKNEMIVGDMRRLCVHAYIRSPAKQQHRRQSGRRGDSE
jgi:hypothetical protein